MPAVRNLGVIAELGRAGVEAAREGAEGSGLVGLAEIVERGVHGRASSGARPPSRGSRSHAAGRRHPLLASTAIKSPAVW
jgi:hypothetical protein